MGLAMGALLCRGADYMERQIVAAQMDYRHRRDALAAYAGILPDGPAKAELQYILIEIERLVKIRDIAAHGTWVKGRKRGTIKPLAFRARGGSVRLRGHVHNEPNYSAETLETAAADMARLYVRLRGFLRRAGRDPFVGVREPRIAKMRATRSQISGSKTVSVAPFPHCDSGWESAAMFRHDDRHRQHRGDRGL